MSLTIYDSWTKGLKRLGTIKNNSNRQMEGSIMRLNQYLNNEGYFANPSERPCAEPRFQGWETSRFTSPLSQRSMGYLWALEFDYIKNQQFNLDEAKYAFDYAYLDVLIDIYSLHLRSLRFPDTMGMPHRIHSIRYSALGMLIGQEQQALNLVKLQLHAHNNGWIGYKKYPIYNLLLNILADYFGLPRIVIPEETNNKALVDSILNCWQTEDVSILEPLLIELCHLHTHKVRTDNDKIRFLHEFNDRIFGYFPFEYFLISKLRAKNGLTTPKISHPIVVTEIDFNIKIDTNEHDDTYLAVIKKMSEQGFDEKQAIDVTLNNQWPKNYAPLKPIYKVLMLLLIILISYIFLH